MVTFLRPMLHGVAVRRAMPKLAMLLVLGMVAAMLVAAVIIGGLYALYITLSAQGFSQLQALLSTVGAALLLLIMCALQMRCVMRRLRPSALPTVDSIASVIDAFMDGFRDADSGKK